MKRYLFFLIPLFFLSLLFLSCQGITPPAPPSEGESEEELPPGTETGRVVLVELFNVEGCPACKAINPIVEDLFDEYSTDEVILVELKGWLEGATPETEERFSWYVPEDKHTPFIAFNGLADTFSEGVSGGGGGGSTPANRPPSINSEAITTATIGEEYTYQVEATDPDKDTLQYCLNISPTGMSIDENTGLISWTPTETHVGENPVEVVVSDLELSDTQPYIINIAGSLCGIVTTDVAGSPVEGSTVEIKDSSTLIESTITDAQGKYGIEDIVTGVYDIIASKEGRVSSKIQNVNIGDIGTTIVDIPQLQTNVPTWECNSPTISVTGIEDGDTLSGTVTGVQVSISDESDIKYLFIAADYIPNELKYDVAYYGYTNVTLPDFNTTVLPDGEHMVTFVVYDMNYNRSQLTITVIIDNQNSGDLPGIPTNLWPLSITFGENIGIFSNERSELYNRMNIQEDSNIINFSGGKTLNIDTVIKAAEPDINLVVQIDWSDVLDATGYKVYRKFEGEENYSYIGASEVPYYLDVSPQLAAGRKTYYQVSAFNSYGESEKSAVEWTVPLRKFNVELVSPQNGATGVSLNPTLQWQPVESVGNYQEYDWYVLGKNDIDYTWNGGGEMVTSWTYDGEPLQSLKVYEWNIDYAIAVDDIYDTGPEYRAVSIAGSGNGSVNGAFEFTTCSE